MVSLDGSTMDVADTAKNNEAFGRPGASRGKAPILSCALYRLVTAILDPDKLSLIHPVRIIRRTLPRFAAVSP